MLLWVTHNELLLCGYSHIEDFAIIYANGKFYELQGYVPAAQAWWIEEVELGEAPETYEPEAHEAAPG